MKSLLLVTTEAPLPSWLDAYVGSRVRVHLSSPEPEASGASLLTGLYPGSLIVAGKERIREHARLDLLARQGVGIYGAVPPALSYLLPAAAEERKQDAISAVPASSVAWCHCPGPVPVELGVRLSPEAAAVFIEIGGAEDLSASMWRTCHLPPQVDAVPGRSILDIIPAVAQGLDLPLPAERGGDPAGGHDRPCFAEDWRNATLAVTAGDETLVARLARGRLSRLLARLPLPRRRRAGTFWEAADLVATASHQKPIAVSYSGPRRGREAAASRSRLLALLGGHLASYARTDDGAVLDRLRDLGYL